MSPNDLRKIFCWLLRGHKWRRLHKQERIDQPNTGGEIQQYRRCDRCGTTRIAAKRKPKEKIA